MTREYQTLIGDGREVVNVHYKIYGDPDEFEVEVVSIYCSGVDVIACLLTQQIVDLEMEIIKHHEKLMSGMADI